MSMHIKDSTLPTLCMMVELDRSLHKNESILLNILQECIPVGCVPPTH